MTDFPAVVYLKPGVSKEVDTSEKEDNPEDVRRVQKPKEYKYSIRSRKRIESYKKLLEALNSVVLKKMDKIENRLDELSQNCDNLEKKVDSLSCFFYSDAYSSKIHQEKYADTEMIKANLTVPFSSKVTHITLNTREDFPRGTWLGFEHNPERRVRCQITPRDLNRVNRRCLTPEKMALTLLDMLFDRETQSCSNISGLGKHKKKQLDPLLIYGIRCHLMYRFDITEEDWNKVKIHIDSKCRTSFRRKQRGLPLLSPKNYNAFQASIASDNKNDFSQNLDVTSIDSKHSDLSNQNSDQEMNCDDISFQSNEDESTGNAFKELMQIISP